MLFDGVLRPFFFVVMMMRKGERERERESCDREKKGRGFHEEGARGVVVVRRRTIAARGALKRKAERRKGVAHPCGGLHMGT